MSCIVCGGNTAAVGSRYDDRYGYPGAYTVRRCAQCGHRALDARMSPEEISDLYTSYYPRSSFDVESWAPPGELSRWQMWWRGSRASAYRWVPPNVKVLDIGCGFGESLGFHRKRGCDAHGVEADRNILRVAEKYGLNVKVGLFSADNYQPSTFDVVTLDQVIEHVTDPAPLLAGIQRVLKPGGMLIVSTPNIQGWGSKVFGNFWIHWHTPYHLQFFTDQSMAISAKKAGFILERRKTVTNSSWLNYQWGHCVTFPAIGEPSVYWNPGRKRTFSQRVALRLLSWAEDLGVNKLLTRLFDATSLGDNRVFVLRKT